MTSGEAGRADADRGDRSGVRTALAGLTTRGRSFLGAGERGLEVAEVLGDEGKGLLVQADLGVRQV
ncbi:hypothetical protein ACWDRX_32665, partial [Streptomyces nigra]